MSGRRMGCSRRIVSVSLGLWCVNGDALRKRNLLEAKNGLKQRAATSDSNL